MKFFVALFMAVCLSLPAGCNTLAKRIEKNRALFDAWPADVQQAVREGKIALGFSKDMVRVAWGKPGRQAERRTEAGLVDVWTYLQWEERPMWTYPYYGYYVRTADGRRVWVPSPMWMETREYQPRETARVEFREDRVVAVEQAKGR